MKLSRWVASAFSVVAAWAATAQSAEPDDYELQPTSGEWVFQPLGELAVGANAALLMIYLDLNKMAEMIGNFTKEMDTAKFWDSLGSEMDLHRAIEMDHIREDAEEMRSYLTYAWDALTAEMADGARRARDLGEGWVALGVGLWNRWSISEINDRVSNDEEAIRATVKQVDAVHHIVEVNERNIRRLHDNIDNLKERLGAVEAKQTCLAGWRMLKGKATAMLEAIADAMAHRMSMSVIKLVDLVEEWKHFRGELMKAGWTPMMDDMLHIFQMQTDVIVIEDKIALIVSVPIVNGKVNLMTLLEVKPMPLWLNGTLIRVETDENLLAVDNQTQATIALTNQDRERCHALGPRWLCLTAHARSLEAAGSCTKTMWARKWDDVAKRCAIVALPVTPQIWVRADNQFVFVTPKRISVTIWCRGGTEAVETVERGMYSLRLKTGCTAVSEYFRTLEGHVEEIVVKVEVPMESWKSFLPAVNRTSWSDLERPEAVSSAVSEVEDRLRRSESSSALWAITAIGVTLAVAIGVAVVLGVLYHKARQAGNHGTGSD